MGEGAKPTYSPYKKAAFTLAEVLITLGIIGVIAAMTIPNLISNYQNAKYIAQLKKSYLVLGQAIQFIQRDFGDVSSWTWKESGDYENFLNTYFKPYFSGSKIYSPSDWKTPMCYEQDIGFQTSSGTKYSYKWLDNGYISTPFTKSTASIRLKDGTCIGVIGGHYSTWERTLAVDTNGSAKGPNTAGKDLFFFQIDDNTKLIPYGFDWSYEDLASNKQHACNKNAENPGFTCAARVMKDGWQIKY